MRKKKGLRSSKPIEVENRYIKRKYDVNKKIYKYGTDDKLPQELIEIVFSSKNAVKGMRKRARYISAYGFTTEEQNKKVVAFRDGVPMTASQLVKNMSVQQSLFQGRAYLVRRKMDGSIATVEDIEFELCRDRGDHIGYNPTFGRNDYKEGAEVKHPKFMGIKVSPSVVSANLEKYEGRGEIFYRFSKDANSWQFPVPDWFSGEFTIRTDSELDQMSYEQAVNAFITSGMLITYGEDDSLNEDENGQTPSQQLDESLRQFSGQKKNEYGMSSRYKLMRMSVGDKQQAPDFIKLQNEEVVNSATTFRDAIGRDVVRLWDVNPVLCGYADASILGNQQALANASLELANSVEGDQNEIEEDFMLLFGGEWKLTKFMPVNYIPDQVWNKMTDDEIRAVGGLQPLETTTPTQNEKVLQTLNTLSPLLSAEIVRRMPDADLFKLIGYEPTDTTTNISQ